MKGPPAALAPPGPRLHRLLGFAWWVLLGLALVGQGGGLAVGYQEAAAEDGGAYVAALYGGFALLSLPFLAAASLLRLREFDNPVSILLSFTFLGIAAGLLGPQAFWEWLGAPLAADLINALWPTLLIVALPAFPDGRFVPRWSRWLMLLGPAMGAADAASLFSEELNDLAVALLLGAALFALMLRYRRMPKGLERQQMKWAAGGLIFGGASIAAAATGLAIHELAALEGMASLGLIAAVLGLLILGLLAIPAGILLSLTRYRLNDADAVIGRSAGYATVTLLIGVLWAVGMAWANRIIGAGLGGSPAATTAVTTVAAALIFVPARERVMGWTERRFQPALVRLRALPASLAQWQHGDDPAVLGRAALGAIIDGVGASGAALAGTEGGVRQIHASMGDDPGTDALRVSLSDRDGEVGLLLLGPRSDGASYSADERTAIALVTEPLACALRATARRARTAMAIAATIAALDERIARLEGRRGTSG